MDAKVVIKWPITPIIDYFCISRFCSYLTPNETQKLKGREKKEAKEQEKKFGASNG